MLSTLTKAEQSAELAILMAAYEANGGKVTTFANMSDDMKARRREQGLVGPNEYDRNARAQFAEDDKAYYDMADRRGSVPVYSPDDEDVDAMDDQISEKRQRQIKGLGS